MEKKSVGMTLMELLVSIVIFSLIMIALTAISSYSYRTIIDASRRSDLQQEASFLIEHITKNVQMAIGSVAAVGIRTDATSNDRIAVRWDRNRDGIPNDDASGDWIAYIYSSGSKQIKYYSTYNSTGWAASGGEVLSSKVSSFFISRVGGTNYIYLAVTVCFDPALACGTRGNPSVTMFANIDTPMVSCR